MRTTITALGRGVRRLLEAVGRQRLRAALGSGGHFTWHAVLSSGAVALPAAQATAKTPIQSTSRSYGSPY